MKSLATRHSSRALSKTAERVKLLPSGRQRMSNRHIADIDERLFLKSVEKTFSVLEAFGRESVPLTLAKIALAAGIDKSGAQRICHTLQALGYLERDPGDRGWIPGKRVLDRSFDYLRYNPLIQHAMPVLGELRRDTRERVDLSLLDDLTIVYAIRMQSKRETFSATLVGRRLPTFMSSGGRAMLSLLPDDEVDAILQRSDRKPITSKTITSIPKIWTKIRDARRDGYALVVEEGLLGEVVLAAAISDRDRRPIAAIHVAGSLSEWSVEDFCKKMHPLAIAAARALSDR
jgi:IclR family transcriptional regulator, pca regulon regulatory protein